MLAAVPPAAAAEGRESFGAAALPSDGVAGPALNPAAAEWRPAPAPLEAAAPPAARDTSGRGRGRSGGRDAAGGRGGRGRGSERLSAPPPPRRAPPAPEAAPAPPSEPESDAATSGAAGRRRAAAANHLLNFSYAAPPRATPPAAARQRGALSSAASYGTVPTSVARMRVDRQRKDLFLQAHFRFVLLDAAAVRLPAAGVGACADTMACWDDVVSVEAATEVAPACPICLEDAPLPAPQITPCGHAFCFPCIARHLALGPGSRGGGGGCPMCFAPVEVRELRRLQHAATSAPAPGRVAAFTLMSRARASLVPRPAGEEVAGGAAQGWPRSSQEGRACRWAKFSLTSDEDSAAAADLAELEAAAAAAVDADSAAMLPALSAAMDAIKGRAAAWAARRAELANEASAAAAAAERAAAALARAALSAVPPPPPPPPGRADGAWDSDNDGDADAEAEPAAARDADEVAAEAELLDGLGRGGDGDAAAAARASAPDEASLSSPAAATLAQSHSGGSTPDPSSYWFYLADDGGFVSLHPATVRALLAGCGGLYAALPRHVAATVASSERGVVSDATRRRLRFLGHLPLRAPFALAELRLEELHLPAAALAAHAPEAAARAKRRAAAERAEAAATARARRAVEQRQAAHAAAAAALRAAAAAVAAERLQDVAMPPLPHRGGAGDAPHAAAQPVPTGASPPTQPGGVSFARVADLGYASGLNAPGLLLATSPSGPGGAGAWPQPSSSPPLAPAPVAPGPRPVWGPRAAAAAAPPEAQAGAGEGAIAAAANTANHKKGRGKATTLLFSTSQRRY